MYLISLLIDRSVLTDVRWETEKRDDMLMCRCLKTNL